MIGKRIYIYLYIINNIFVGMICTYIPLCFEIIIVSNSLMSLIYLFYYIYCTMLDSGYYYYHHVLSYTMIYAFIFMRVCTLSSESTSITFVYWPFSNRVPAKRYSTRENTLLVRSFDAAGRRAWLTMHVLPPRLSEYLSTQGGATDLCLYK